MMHFSILHQFQFIAKCLFESSPFLLPTADAMSLKNDLLSNGTWGGGGGGG